ncbi:GspE/PulE family protein [Fusibacter sp. JL216-2]|uniref:GspE/PulE family protein n=1 Tax=Fusibacter sp. JL216-2 TaxID=3071453 RepID=UPI003D348970
MKQRETFRLGDLLVKVGAITDEQLKFALELQREKKKKLGDVLQDLEFVTQKQIIEALEFQLGIPQVDLEKYYIDPEIPRLVSEEFARKHKLIPIKKQGMTLHVAMSDPLNIIVINDLEIVTGYQVEARIATEADIDSAINTYFSKQTAEEAVEEFTKEFEVAEDEIDQNLLREINKAPVVRLVNTIIVQAAQSRASDIHIEPQEESLRIRFRVDGDLQEVMRPAKQTHGAIITRIKIMAKMNIAERRVPQDGRIELDVQGRDLDLRVSTIPTIYGEKVVIRMLDRSNFLRSVSELGLNKHEQDLFKDITRSTNGMILVTGPTGSGKSTTVYTLLSELNDSKKNVITVEDPVEYRMKGVIQSQVNHKAGFDFASGLKSMLRQDPDVIMVGEIRDRETAEIAVRAGITGHLVLSTLHTNSASQTINRLLDMKVEKYLLASSVVAIIAQTLVKKMCPNCKLPYMPDSSDLATLGYDSSAELELYQSAGCSVCKNTGYLGRTAVYEIMKLDYTARTMIMENVNPEDLRNYMRKAGMKTLQENCREMVLRGETTVEELVRISYSLEG